MGRKPSINKRERIEIFVSEETKKYLDALSRSGGYIGNNPGDMAGAIVEDRVAQLIQDGFLERSQKTIRMVEKILKKTP